jgi:hypothetical protein
MPFSWVEHQLNTTCDFAPNNPFITFYCEMFIKFLSSENMIFPVFCGESFSFIIVYALLTRKYDRSANWRAQGLKLYYPKRLQAQ